MGRALSQCGINQIDGLMTILDGVCLRQGASNVATTLCILSHNAFLTLVGTDVDNNVDARAEQVLEQTQQYLKSYSLSKIFMPTIAQWMHATGF